MGNPKEPLEMRQLMTHLLMMHQLMQRNQEILNPRKRPMLSRRLTPTQKILKRLLEMHIYLKLISQIGICGPPKDTVDPIGPSISVANYEFSSENLINQVFAIKLNRMLISGPGRTIYGPFGSQKNLATIT